MPIDFPVATTVGQTFVAGGITYTWNGQGWTPGGSGAAVPIPEAPLDGQTYARKSAAWESISTGASVVHRAGCGRLLRTSATVLTFAPYNGAQIRIAGVWYDIPAGGISAGNTGVRINNVAGQNLAANTQYLVTLGFISGALSFDFLTASSHNYDTSVGNVGTEIPSGSPLRSVIGMVFPNNPSAQFDDWRVLSWFNRRPKTAYAVWSGPLTVGGGTMQSLAGAAVVFPTWGDTPIIGDVIVNSSNDTPGAIHTLGAPFLDGTQLSGVLGQNVSVPAANYWITHTLTRSYAMTEGAHTLSPAFAINGGNPTVSTECQVTTYG